MKTLFKKLRPHVFGGQQVSQRDALVLEFIARQPKGSKLLDAGAGPQRFRASCRHLQYVSQDFGAYSGGDDFAGEPLEAWNSQTCDVISDITDIPLETGTVDSIICVEVLEHIPRPADALREFARLLKPAGRVLITAPFNSQYHQLPYFYFSGFSSEFYRYHATQLGLRVVQITPIGDYYQSLAQELLRLPFLKSGTLLRILSALLLPPAYAYLWLLHALRVPSPRSPMCYVAELQKD
jgi:ubiquinone/menaquinone biosynthesis C-methylase UbiE